MDFNYAIKRLKAATGADTDTELRGKALISRNGMTSIKAGNASIKLADKLCSAWHVRTSAFIRWAEEGQPSSTVGIE